MRPNLLKKVVIGAFAGVMVLFGSLVASPTASAQVRVVRVAPARVFIGPRFFGPGFYPYYFCRATGRATATIEARLELGETERIDR